MDDSRIDEIFEYLENVNVDLDYDPIRRGPKFLNNMIATTRNLTNKVQKIEREVSRQLLLYERQLNKLEAEHDLKYNDLLSNNEDVINLSSSSDRKAKAEDMLKDLKGEIQKCKSNLTDLGHVESIVSSKLRELRGVNRSLNKQIRLVEDEIKTGNWWGDQGDDNQPIQDEDVDLDSMLPENSGSTEEEVDVEEYESLFGKKKDSDSESNSDTDDDLSIDDEDDEDYAQALDSIDPEPKGNSSVFDDDGDDEGENSKEDSLSDIVDDNEVDVDDLLSGFQ